MKALSIRPWPAIEIFFTDKTIELRKWQTDHRGDILICSTAERDPDTIPGHALCVAELYDIVPFTRDMCNAALVEPEDFEAGWYAWKLRNIRMIKPFRVKGQLRLWECDTEITPFIPQNEAEDEAWFQKYYNDLFV